MDKIQLKKEIYDAALKKNGALIDDFRQRIRAMMATDGNVNEEEYDSQVQSQKSEAVDNVSLLSAQLDKANQQWEELKKIEENISHQHSAVELGSVVSTDKDVYFVAVSLPGFSVNGIRVIGLSIQSPLFQAMKGKKAGDTIWEGNKSYRVIEVY